MRCCHGIPTFQQFSTSLNGTRGGRRTKLTILDCRLSNFSYLLITLCSSWIHRPNIGLYLCSFESSVHDVHVTSDIIISISLPFIIHYNFCTVRLRCNILKTFHYSWEIGSYVSNILTNWHDNIAQQLKNTIAYNTILYSVFVDCRMKISLHKPLVYYMQA